MGKPVAILLTVFLVVWFGATLTADVLENTAHRHEARPGVCDWQGLEVEFCQHCQAWRIATSSKHAAMTKWHAGADAVADISKVLQAFHASRNCQNQPPELLRDTGDASPDSLAALGDATANRN